MNLYFVRHGIAGNSAADKERELTRQGKENLLKDFKTWDNYINSIDYIITSPYKRTYQTAELIHKYYKINSELIIENSLAPGCYLENVLPLIEALEAEDILLVGHMPDVAFMVSELTNSYRSNFDFFPGSIAGVTIGSKLKEGQGTLRFFLSALK